jgi:Na+-transporting NADH:ubiquinone oxidoreductase subunit NqrF
MMRSRQMASAVGGSLWFGQLLRTKGRREQVVWFNSRGKREIIRRRHSEILGWVEKLRRKEEGEKGDGSK